MKFKKVLKENFEDDFYKTFKNLNMKTIEIKESINAIWELIQLPIYNDNEDCYYITMPFGIELAPEEHMVIPLGIECDSSYYKAKSDNPRYTVETVTQTGDIFVHVENISNEVVTFEPDQLFCKFVGTDK